MLRADNLKRSSGYPFAGFLTFLIYKFRECFVILSFFFNSIRERDVSNKEGFDWFGIVRRL